MERPPIPAKIATEADLGHLHPKAQALAHLPLEERIIARWPSLWIGHRAADDVFKTLDRYLLTPPSIRPRNLLIFGESGVGKSTILNRWESRVRADNAKRVESEDHDGAGEWVVLPAIRFQTPPAGDEAKLYNNILLEFGMRLSPSMALAQKELMVRRLIAQCGVRVMLMDEFHNALSGRFDKRLHFNVLIKNLTNETGVPIVAAGTESVDQVFQKEDQLNRRFNRLKLERMKMDGEWRRILRAYGKLIPLRRPSDLSEAGLSERLYALSKGVIGELSNILYDAALAAVDSGEECITDKLIRLIR
ncbi:TniB family NTP-binding protein [Segnochrobactrum spirostomi]|uniref:AAA family ATPase n=1 Tax=Segnochrobactrum spirostomi TaxID=2608987 RepID=A0A6A7Y4N9_9HYPH|nr:TniB family NTP-binding protein [Segnochrobactrum spirostomi]MQT13061.1 AAA family ATPase [Segnochrobactrum spirostomi]